MENDSLRAKYNSGVNKIIRMDLLWKDVNRHKRDGLFQKWNDDLDCIWCELVPDAMKKKLLDETQRDMDKINTNIVNVSVTFNDFGSSLFKKPNEQQLINRKKHYKLLMEKEILLRKLEERIGKGSAWDDEEEDDF